MSDISPLLFLILSAIVVIGASCVLLAENPIYAALSLASTMIGLGFMYFQLEAYFIAGVQLIVYAGAVMVLFVMVVMLFDLQKDTASKDEKVIPLAFKIAMGIIISSILFSAIRSSIGIVSIDKQAMNPSEQVASVKQLAVNLFTENVFTFEVLGILLLVIAVGVVAVSRTRGGTHVRD